MSGAPDPDEPAAGPEGVNAPPEAPASDHFVVGIGASAGGLEAISEVLKNLPDLSGLALVIVQHLDPIHESHLVELLGRHTAAPVTWAEHGRPVVPGHVYVVPPHTCATLRDRALWLEPSVGRPGGEIDFFLRSLAGEARECAAGVVLSGNGSDGASGLRAIKSAGGFTFAQQPETATFSSMPRAAIEARAADRVLPPVEIARELGKLPRDLTRLRLRLEEALPAGEAEQLAAIFRLLSARTGVDFSDYKQSTIKRRLARRMLVARAPDLAAYVKLLHQSRDEWLELHGNLLIHVTEFFRDPECFEFLREKILPAILERHRDGSPIRVWVPGCATGEEAYSIAILLQELLEAEQSPVPVQIFATDVSEEAIATARAGRYTAADVANLPPERVRRFFLETEQGFVVQKTIRDLCVFARQNVVRDSPFSRLDLISCRNLMIYFGPKLQRKLMPIFHYALAPAGYLMLGTSESIGSHTDLYRLVDRRFRVYSRKSSARRTAFEFAHDYAAESAAHAPAATLMADDPKEPFDIVREADRIVLGRHGPTGVLVNEDLEILQFRGDVSPYLAPVPGRASLNLLRMLRDGLGGDLQLAIRQAREQNVRVHRPGIAFVQDGVARQVDVDVTPIEAMQPKECFFLVLFEPAATRSVPASDAAPKTRRSRKTAESIQVERLRQDLEGTRNYLQTAIEKHEATNQELRAANEEIQSSNEELQSTNEELETAKEELQSTNEELTTVNEELHSRHLDLIQVNNDLHNLINSVHLPIIILGQDLRIRRFTPMAEKVLNVIPTDIGRPLSDLNLNLTVKDLPRMIGETIETLAIRECEVQDGTGRWFSLRLRPYKTADQKIDGVVLTLIDIDAIKRTAAEAEEARNLAQAVVETTREPLAALTADLRIKTANDAFYRLFGTTRERAEGRSFFDAVNAPEKLGELRRTLEEILPAHTTLANHEVGLDLPGKGPVALTLDVRQITSGSQKYPLILLTLRTR